MLLGRAHFPASQGHRLEHPLETELRLLVGLPTWFGFGFRSLRLGPCGIVHANVRPPLIILGSDGSNPERPFAEIVDA